jgi:hypothetical protein
VFNYDTAIARYADVLLGDRAGLPLPDAPAGCKTMRQPAEPVSLGPRA